MSSPESSPQKKKKKADVESSVRLESTLVVDVDHLLTAMCSCGCDVWKVGCRIRVCLTYVGRGG